MFIINSNINLDIYLRVVYRHAWAKGCSKGLKLICKGFTLCAYEEMIGKWGESHVLSSDDGICAILDEWR